MSEQTAEALKVIADALNGNGARPEKVCVELAGMTTLQMQISGLRSAIDALNGSMAAAFDRIEQVGRERPNNPHAVADGMRAVIQQFHVECSDPIGIEKFDGYSAVATRAANCLRNELGCEPKPYAVSQLSERELLRFSNVGRKTITLIKAWLAHHGLELRR